MKDRERLFVVLYLIVLVTAILALVLWPRSNTTRLDAPKQAGSHDHNGETSESNTNSGTHRTQTSEGPAVEKEAKRQEMPYPGTPEFYRKLTDETDKEFRQRIEEVTAEEEQEPNLARLSGRVIDEYGIHVADARITLKAYHKRESEGTSAFGTVSTEKVAFTKPDGYFSFANLKFGRKLAYVSKPGFIQASPKEVHLNKHPEGSIPYHHEITIALRRDTDTSEISGICRDQEGTPVRGAEIKVLITEFEQRSNVHFGKSYTGIAGEDGRFTISGLPRGKTRIRAMAANYQDAFAEDVLTGTTDVILIFERRLGVISGAIQIPPESDVQKFVVILAATSRTARDIRTEIEVEGEGTPFLFKEVQPGVYAIFVHAKGFAYGESRNINVTPGAETTDITIRLTAGATLSGTVKWKDSDKHVSDAQVTLKPLANGYGRIRQIKTDKSGAFILQNVTPGQYLVLATKSAISSPGDGVQVSLIDGGEKQVEIELPKGKTIRGKITCEDQKAFASIQVFCYPKDAQPIVARPSAGGYFAFHHLGPGNYKVALMDTKTRGLLRIKEISLSADANQRADFSLKGITFNGSITIDGQICQNMPFSLKGDEASCMVVTDDLGHFTARYVPPGKYTASFQPPGTDLSNPKIEIEIEVPQGKSEFTYDFNL